MSAFLHITLPRRVAINPAVLIIGGYLLVGALVLQEYLILQSLNFVLGMAALLFVWKFRSGGARSYRLAWFAVGFMVLCILVPAKTLLYFSVAAALLFTIEWFYGRTGILSLLVMMLMSPVFRYATDTFSFPIRLALTRIAGAVLNAAGEATLVKGNVIIRGGEEFSVDPGCMGLSMMEASLLLGVMLIAFFRHQLSRRLSGTSLLLYLVLIMLLNVIANLFRILVLVHFSILPGTVAHEAAGLLCLVLYVFIPAVFLARWFVRRSPHQQAGGSAAVANHSRYLLPAVLLTAVAALAIDVARTDTNHRIDLSSVRQGEGYTASLAAPGVVKLEDDRSLIYIKYVRGFYDTDHTPMTCWKGSGYVFDQVQQEKKGGHAVYTAELLSGSEKLYSAWWYSNGDFVTSDQLVWRWKMMRSRDHYAVVNVTCADKAALDHAIQKIITGRTLLPFFQKTVYN